MTGQAMRRQRARILVMLFVSHLIWSALPAKPKRQDAGTFVIRLRSSTDKIAKDHPSYVGARKALWDCWTAYRSCAVTLRFDYSLDNTRRQDVFLDVGKDGTRTLVLREEHRTKSFDPEPYATDDAPSDVTRRFTALDRIPLDGKWDGPALAEDDASSPEHWRLRFRGGEPVTGAPGPKMLGDYGIAVW